MVTWKEFLTNEGYELLAEAKRYTDELSKDDPDEEPYRSFYSARENYNTVQKFLKKLADKRNQDEDFKFVWAALELKIGVNYMNTEEKATGEEYFQKCLEKLEDFKLTQKGTGIYQNTLNQMGILCTGRNKPDEALQYFKQAELLYIDFKSIVGASPWMIDEFLSPPLENIERLEYDRALAFESAYTHTLFYFAQVYQQLGRKDISAYYCHITLQRQLDAPDLDKLDWSLHAAALSQYYMAERNFSMSRHCLASSEVIFEQAEVNNINCPDEIKEKIEQARADIQRCWIKYGLGLLEYSREKLITESNKSAVVNNTNEIQKSSAEPVDIKTESSAGTSKADMESSAEVNDINIESMSVTSEIKMKSSSSGEAQVELSAETETEPTSERSHVEAESDKLQDVECVPSKKLPEERFNIEVTSHEEKITDQQLQNFEQAREVFLMIKKWIEMAKEFYKFDYHCSDYVSIVQDHSLSFKFLSFFELDLERQCKMHKRRINMLSEMLTELNPQHYLLICRQLMFEIADTYSAMLDLKLAIMDASGEGVQLTPHHIKKINALAKESIKYYQDYLNTLKGGQPVYPDEFPINDVRPGLVAMFCMGRLHSKIITGDVQTKLLNIKKSKDCYQFVVDYCKKNASAAALVEAELDICKEMVFLLPSKMERIRIQSEI